MTGSSCVSERQQDYERTVHAPKLRSNKVNDYCQPFIDAKEQTFQQILTNMSPRKLCFQVHCAIAQQHAPLHKPEGGPNFWLESNPFCQQEGGLSES